MAVSYFIYVTDKENTGFDLEKFNNDIKQRFPKVGILVKDDEKCRYNICWEDYEDEYEFDFGCSSLKFLKAKYTVCSFIQKFNIVGNNKYNIIFSTHLLYQL